MNLSREKSLETVLVMSGALLVFYFIFKEPVLISISLGLIVVIILSNFMMRVIAWAWLKFAEGLGFIMSKVILTVVFFTVLVPVSLLRRLTQKSDTLGLRKSTGSSYYTTRNHKYVKEDLDKVW